MTPNLNRLASESTHFQRAYSTCPLCVPARTALATGLYPTRNGVVLNKTNLHPPGDHPPLHQHFAEAGYDVAHIGINHIQLCPGIRERVDFAAWTDVKDYAEYAMRQGLAGVGAAEFVRAIRERQGDEFVDARYSNTQTAVWPHDARHFMDSFFSRRAIEFLEAQRSRPFALFLYLWAPHPPLTVPDPFASRFDPGGILLPPNVDVPAAGEPPNRRKGAAAQIAEGLTPEEWRAVWAAHLGLVNMADALVGEVLDALDHTGLADETTVVFTSDHGDHLGQHRMYQKMEMYEQAIKVPLLIRHPGCTHRTIDSPVSHLDLMPTLLELAGLPVPVGLDGFSLRESVMSGEENSERVVFAQYSGNRAVGDIRRAAISRRFKYVYDPDDIPELYDLERDPLESVNLGNLGTDATANAEPLRELEHACRAWGEAHGDWVWSV